MIGGPKGAAARAGLMPKCGALAFAFVIFMSALALPISGVVAEEKWQPTVTTTNSDVVRRVTVPAAPLPVWNDPRYRSRPQVIKSPQDSPLPQGAWSSIITGAVPSEARALAPSEERARFVQNDAPSGAAQRPSSAQAGPAAALQAPSAVPADAANDAIVPRQRPLEALPPDATAAQQYCFNSADSAADARFAWQAKKIKEMEAELEKRAAQLEAKTEEYKKWLARRDEFSKKAQEKLVAFYAKMRPDAAALHMTAMDDEAAAALLTKLEPKVASLVMAEIAPEKAAKIAAVISGAARIPPNRRPRPAPPPAAQQGAAQPSQGDGSAATPDSRSRS